jgi:hypothetical protein
MGLYKKIIGRLSTDFGCYFRWMYLLLRYTRFDGKFFRVYDRDELVFDGIW